MPTLEFKGKQHIYAHHLTVPYRPLIPDGSKSVNPSTDEDDNLIIHGDNLHALKALLPRYAGRVKCIYIDPPYNTGNGSWLYSDRVNSPLMKEWLAKNSSVDGEDLERHDKWLTMMWPRLHLLRDLLSEEGAIFISIDDNEQHHLRMLMDEVFGQDQFVVTIAWRKRSTPPNDKTIGADHDYILVYCKNINLARLNLQERTPEQSKRYKNPDNHPKGPWVAGDLMANVKGGRFVQSLSFPIVNPATGQEHYPGERGNWRFSQDTILELLTRDEIWFGSRGTGRPKLKRFLSDVKEGTSYPSMWTFVPMNMTGSMEMQAIFGDATRFESPKPVGLIQELMRLGSDKDSIVLDSFAGSGTTAHAVLALNKEDGGNRKFILVECENYADDITAERVRRVIEGVPSARDEKLREGLGGSFTYATLGDPIDAESLLNGDSLPTFQTLASYLLHTATGISAGQKALKSQNKSGLFYSTDSTNYYLLYKPDSDWLRSDAAMFGESVAKRIRSAIVPKKKDAVVFAPGKFIGQRELTALGITFSQIPYDIHRQTIPAS